MHRGNPESLGNEVTEVLSNIINELTISNSIQYTGYIYGDCEIVKDVFIYSTQNSCA